MSECVSKYATSVRLFVDLCDCVPKRVFRYRRIHVIIIGIAITAHWVYRMWVDFARTDWLAAWFYFACWQSLSKYSGLFFYWDEERLRQRLTAIKLWLDILKVYIHLRVFHRNPPSPRLFLHFLDAACWSCTDGREVSSVDIASALLGTY